MSPVIEAAASEIRLTTSRLRQPWVRPQEMGAGAAVAVAREVEVIRQHGDCFEGDRGVSDVVSRVVPEA